MTGRKERGYHESVEKKIHLLTEEKQNSQTKVFPVSALYYN
jgi:hypothetical protein